jgi:hypothetical protein
MKIEFRRRRRVMGGGSRTERKILRVILIGHRTILVSS